VRQKAARLLINNVLLLICLPVFPQAEPPVLEFDVNGGILYPLDFGLDLLNLGPVVDLAGRISFSKQPFLRPAVDLSYAFLPVPAETSLSLFGIGLGIELLMEPAKRLHVTASLTGGGYYGFFNTSLFNAEGIAIENQQGGGGLISAGAGIGYYLSPALKLGAKLRYSHYIGFTGGIQATLEAAIDLDGFTRKTRLETPGFNRLFPVQYKYYDNHPVGRVVISNNERFPIRDVTVSVYAKQYMDEPKVSKTVENLKPGGSTEVDLYILFNNSILNLTESEKISAQIVVSYELNGRRQSLDTSHTLDVQNRNAITWDDDRKAAAFVTPKDEEVLRFAKQIAGLVRTEGPAAVNLNLRMGMGMFEALCAYRLNYVVDPNTLPYEDAAKNTQIADFLQFPIQTLYYKGGDCDDLSILFCSLLEAVGIETAFVIVPGHIFSAFSLNIPAEEAARIFESRDDFIYIDGETWVPVETTMVDKNFLSAMREGAAQWREYDGAGLLPMHENWGEFESAGTPDIVVSIVPPDYSVVAERFSLELDGFIDMELYTRVEQYRRLIASSRSPSKIYNRLGVLFARFGKSEKAEVELKASFAQSEYVPGMVNLGNLYYVDGRNEDALELLTRADALQPENPTIKLSLARIYFETGNFALVNALYADVKETAPGLADNFSYLARLSSDESESRAEDITSAKSASLWMEE
jgi:tetratricopeptide (TPR) repeat protein